MSTTTETRAVGRVIWPCDVCGRPVDRGEGYVTVFVGDVERAELASLATEAVGFSGLSKAWARWHVLHTACYPPEFEERAEYPLPVGELSTVGDVLMCTVHLMEKSWLPHTTWRSMLYRVADQLGAKP